MVGSDIQQKNEVQNFGMNESPILIPHKKHPEECAWPEYCNDFEKIERQSIFSFKATNLQHVRLEMKKE